MGAWTRIEGTPNDPNPNKPFAKLEAISTFTNDGKLNPSITVIGKCLLLLLCHPPGHIEISSLLSVCQAESKQLSLWRCRLSIQGLCLNPSLEKTGVSKLGNTWVGKLATFLAHMLKELL